MEKQTFLKQFSQQLHVGSPKREEILTESRHHLDQRKFSDIEQELGQPKKLARQYNRTHLGYFSSFSRLALIRILCFLLLELGWPLISLSQYAGSATASWPVYVKPMNILAQVLPMFLFFYGSYRIGQMRSRWVYGIIWAISFPFAATFILLLNQTIGYSIYINLNGDPIGWLYHLTYFFTLALVHVPVALGIIVAASGRYMVFPRHRLFDLLFVFLAMGAATYFFVPIIWNMITANFYTSSMQHVDEWLYHHALSMSFAGGLIGALGEWVRQRKSRNLLPTLS